MPKPLTLAEQRTVSELAETFRVEYAQLIARILDACPTNELEAPVFHLIDIERAHTSRYGMFREPRPNRVPFARKDKKVKD